jgi:signal transduction histidine kinase/AmiR/NasT family two-component response regulator
LSDFHKAIGNIQRMTDTSATQGPGTAPADNITEVRRQESLLKTGALQNAILNSANFSSIATDEKGVIQIFNVGAERMLGYAAADVMNKITPADISDPQEVIARAKALSVELGTPITPGFEALVFKASRGIEDIYELTYIRKDGSRFPAIVSVTALRDEYAVIIGYLLIGTDNTARKQVEEEQKKLDQVLQENNIELQNAMSAAEKANLAKSDFLSSMSHELRTPLSAILGFAQLIESGEPPPTASQKRSVDQILLAGWYLLKLINEILDLALIESGKLSLSPEPISLTAVMRECEAMVEPQASKHHIAVRFPALATEYIVRADRTRFKQILINLLSNAIKYNKPGGKVTVDIVAVSPERLRICVADTGAGLPPEKIAQLFQPFNRLGREGNADEGTGIGLVMTKRLVELMDGVIGVQSSVGQGSVFWVEMNLTRERQSMTPADAAAAAAQPQGPIDNNIRTLLYVEDNPANRMLVETLMERRPGIRLLTAGDGWRGIALARQEQPDVILMDINLPGISGIKALKILENDPLTAHIPIVALSANAMPHDIVKGLEAGFFRYLTKPIKVHEFMDTLDEAMRFAKAVSAQVQKEVPP